MWTARDRELYKEDGRRYPSDLSEAEWNLIWPLVATYRTLTRDLREMVNGCLYLAAEGCRWRSLPKDFGPWQTVRGYWDRFPRDGIWADAAALLTPAARARVGKNPKLSTGIVDAQASCQARRGANAGLMATRRSRASSATS
jgi:putative transposase